jgi:hypothetical protein
MYGTGREDKEDKGESEPRIHREHQV